MEGFIENDKLKMEHFNFPQGISCRVVMIDGSEITVKALEPLTKESIQVGDALICKRTCDEAVLGDVIEVKDNQFKLELSILKMHNESRKHFLRYPLSLAAALGDMKGQLVFAVAKDISKTGIRLNCQQDFAELKDVDINISIQLKPQEKNIQFCGRIVNKRSVSFFNEYGISITSMDSEEREKFDAYIKTLNKQYVNIEKP